MGGGSEKVGSPGAVGHSGLAADSSSAVALSPEELVAVATGLKMLGALLIGRQVFVDGGYGPCWMAGAEATALFKVEQAMSDV